MDAAKLPSLVEWETFYVIVGSSAAALTGLQFVVIALIGDRETRASTREIDTFSTPTIVHFCAVLLISALMTAPWQTLWSVAFGLGALGAAGGIHGLVVIRRAKAVVRYKLVLEDWIWHAALPLAAYTATLLASAALMYRTGEALFVIASTALLLLFAGIHNAWDTVTYIAVGQAEELEAKKPADS